MRSSRLVSTTARFYSALIARRRLGGGTFLGIKEEFLEDAFKELKGKQQTWCERVEELSKESGKTWNEWVEEQSKMNGKTWNVMSEEVLRKLEKPAGHQAKTEKTSGISVQLEAHTNEKKSSRKP